MDLPADDVGGRIPLPFSSPLPKNKIAEIAATELGETEEKVREGITEMRHYIRKNNIACCEDEDFLLKFLRVKKFRLLDSNKMMEGFTKSLKEFCDKIGPVTDVLAVKKSYQKNVNGILPYRDSDGRATMFYRFGIYYKEGIQVVNSTKAINMLLYLLMQDPGSQTAGVNWIVDCKRIGFRDVYESIELGLVMSKFLTRVPLRINRIDILNESFLYRILWNTFKSFYTKKFRERIHFHGSNLDEIVDVYGRSELPDEFGGTGGEISNDHWSDRLSPAIEQWIKLQDRATV